MQIVSAGTKVLLRVFAAGCLAAMLCLRAPAQTVPEPTPTPEVIPGAGPASTETAAPLPDTATQPQRLRLDPALASQRILYNPAPEFPSGVPAKAAGPVRFDLVVGTDGRVTRAKAVSGDPLLHGRAVATAQEWRYTPYIVDGDPMEFETTTEMEFRPGNNSPRALAIAAYQAGYSAFRRGAYQDALKAFRRVLQYDPKFPEAWNEVGRIHLVRDEYAEALTAFQKELQANPNNAHARNNLGLTHWLQKHYTEALAGYREQLRQRPRDATAISSIGLIHEEQKDYAAAAQELEKAIALAPDEAALRIALANCYCRLKQESKCTAIIEAAAARRDTAENWHAVASAMAARGLRLEQAQKYALRAVTTLEMLVREADADHVTRKNLQDMDALTAAWNTLGRIYMLRDKLEDAERYLRAAWMLRPDNDLFAQLLEKKGEKEEAVRHYRMSLAQRQDAAVKQRLEALAGEASTAETLAAAHRDLAKLDNAKIGIAPKDLVQAEFYLLSSAGSPGAARWIGGDESLKPLSDALGEMKDPAQFTGSPAGTVLRRLELTCMKKGEPCSARLLPPKQALERIGGEGPGN